MKAPILFVLLALSATGFAQKNVVPVSSSAVTGITLPAGSKKDGRLLSIAATEILFSLETDKVNATLSETEVLMLPPAVPGGFGKDSLSIRLKAQGWSIVPVSGDERYSWLYKDKRTVIAYYTADAKSTLLYFSNAKIPVTAVTSAGETKQTLPANQTVASTSAVSQTSSVPEEKKAPATQAAAPLSASGGYSFFTTNFDDGWKSTEKQDWVELVKDNITVLLHYHNAAAGTPTYDYRAVTSNAWNILVAGRYSDLQNFWVFSGAVEYEPAYFGTGDVRDNATGKQVFVALFRKGGNTWTEIISPDRSAFARMFGIDLNKSDFYQGSSTWDPLSKLTWYNRFAVGPTDIRGKWTNNFSGMQQYVNAFTGANAGMDTYSSSQVFEFADDGSYKWEISVASGFVGSIKFQNVKSSGKATLTNNWQIHFTDIEGKPKTYNAYFSCIRGARILWLEDSAYPTGYSSYGKM